MTAAPATTPPEESFTTPDTVCAEADRAKSSRNANRDAVRMTGK
jgi:hypothetical protein